MTTNGKIVPAESYFLKPGYIFLSVKPTIISTVLGSSVSVCLYDRKRKVGGMNHFKLPSIADPKKSTAEYGNIATLTLIRMMLEDGSKRKHLEAQIFGGAFREGAADADVGSDNVKVARKVLERERLKVVSEDVGGQKGRKIVFDTIKNEIAIIKVEKIRAGDWYPYEGDR
jgi:chemotaxis protein CheD